MLSPYEGKSKDEWASITDELISSHPLDTKVLVETVFEAWNGILNTKIGGFLQIGKDIFPSPQIIGNYLHELIPIILERKYRGIWAKDSNKNDKDLVYVPDDTYSIEIKTSSQSKIYGNRSYGQPETNSDAGKKKYGYYIAINFQKISKENPNASIKSIKFRLVRSY